MTRARRAIADQIFPPERGHIQVGENFTTKPLYYLLPRLIEADPERVAPRRPSADINSASWAFGVVPVPDFWLV